MIFRHVMPHGKFRGFTIAMERTNSVIAYGVATCSRNDQFCRSTGRSLAAERLLSYSHLIIPSDVVSAFIAVLPRGVFSTTGLEKLRNSLQASDLTDEIIFRHIFDDAGLSE